MMTDEELQYNINEVSERLDSLGKSEESLSHREERQKQLLLMEKITLKQIKKARENKDRTQELQSTLEYNLMKSWWGKHPLLAHLIRINLKWNPF